MDHSTTMRTIYDRINAGDIDGFGALMADGFVEHEEQPGLAPTKQGVMEFFRMLRAAFPDMRPIRNCQIAHSARWRRN